MTDPKGNEEDNQFSTKIADDWMIRRCTLYDDEYNDCISFKARFNQYFIYGKPVDCSQWKKDSTNCYKWVENKDVNAAKELVESEKARRRERLLSHQQNDIWERRTAPPEDWNKPLPEHLQKEYEHTYLNLKAKELRGEIPPSFDANVSFCSIM